jgi:Mg-chelatase subunit ChlD
MDLQRAMNRLTKEHLSELNSFIVEEGYYRKKEEKKKNGAPVLLIVQASR